MLKNKLTQSRVTTLWLLRLFFIIGCMVVLLNVKWGMAEYSTNHWPSIEGTVTATEVKYDHSSHKNADSYLPIIHYRYEVNGVVYQRSQRQYDNIANFDQTEAMTILMQYPDKTSVTVFYQSNKPGQSTLLTGVMARTWLGLYVGLGFALYAWAYLKRLKKKP